MRGWFLASLGLSYLAQTSAVTIYTTILTDENGKVVAPTNTNTAVGPAYTGYGAYNMTVLQPPVTTPDQRGGQDFGVPLATSANTYQNLSIPVKGGFMGLSIELSVANQFLGRNSSAINVPFLNYLGNLRSRIGHGPTVRVGGNSQEFTRLFLDHGFKHYEFLNKTPIVNPLVPTNTPEVDIDIDMLYALSNITALVGTQWYLGLAFGFPVNNTGNAEMATIMQEILGDNLIALQLGNEPDLYGLGHRKRPTDYPITEYLAEMQNATSIYKAGVPKAKSLVLPSVCCNIINWGLNNLSDAGFFQQFTDTVAQYGVQHYPNNNCAGNVPPPPAAQDVFATFLTHTNPVGNAAGYLPFTAIAVQQNVPFVMFETNTGSCSGWPGVSDSFAAALWGVDWALQLAYSNFSTALFHFGGQDAAYNAFTPPPSNFSKTFQWSTGPLYYSMLMVAEALGGSNKSQVVDISPAVNNGNPLTPAYAIYENGAPQRVVLINYINDQSNGSTYRAYIHVGGQNVDGTAETTPTSVTVRYLSAPTVQEKYNIQYNGQTMGGLFDSDGRLKGSTADQTITCTQPQGCMISVPAPGAALVFLNPTALSESGNSAAATQTFPTTYFGRGAGPTVEQAVLETSNGRGGSKEADHPLGSTSHGNDRSGAMVRYAVGAGLVTGTAVALGAMLLTRSLIK